MLSPIQTYFNKTPVLMYAFHWAPALFALAFTYGANEGSDLLYDKIEYPWLICNESNNECRNVEVISIFEHGIFFKSEDKINFKYSSSNILISSANIPKNHKIPLQDIGSFLNIKWLAGMRDVRHLKESIPNNEDSYSEGESDQ